MNNVLGQPVDGDDFFDREDETRALWNSLVEGNHVLLLAPRRVGKTSLAIRVGADAVREGWKFVLVDAERDRDELGFLDDLFQNLKLAGVKVPMLARLTEWVTFARRNLAGKVEGGGFSFELCQSEGEPASTLEQQVERLFRELEESGERLLIAVDELPVLLEALEEGDARHVRLRTFLNWFRALRQRYRRSIRWLLLGSVGLDTFLELRHLTVTINDLQSSSLGAYPPQTAIKFFQALGQSKQLFIGKEAAEAVIEEIGWPLPFFLQLVFHECYTARGDRRGFTVEDVRRACRRLQSPEFYKHFEPWRGRLSEGMPPEHHRAATAILNAVCVHRAGLPRTALLNAVMSTTPYGDPDAVARVVATTLGQLERDGYLLRHDGEDGAAANYAFRSFLLRHYWHARELA